MTSPLAKVNVDPCGIPAQNIVGVDFNLDSETRVFDNCQLKVAQKPRVVVKQYHHTSLYQIPDDVIMIQKEFSQLINIEPHPNLSRYLSFFKTADHIHFAREFVEGIPFTEAIPAGRFGMSLQIRLTVQIARAINYLRKELGDIHPDITFAEEPIEARNIIFVPDTETAVLVDYQITRLRDSVRRKWDSLNRATIGLPIYPPEYFRLGHYVPEKSIMFSVALVSYMMISKSVPKVRRFKDPPNVPATDPYWVCIKKNISEHPEDRNNLTEWIGIMERIYQDIVSPKEKEADLSNLDASLALRYMIFGLTTEFGNARPKKNIDTLTALRPQFNPKNSLLKAASVNLSNKKLNYLPEAISHLRNLEELDLSFNELTGIPEILKECKSLRNLNMSSNRIRTITGPSVRAISGVSMLKLSNNRISSLPDEFSSLSMLSSLTLSCNKIEDVPVVISNIRGLRRLDISGNKVSSLAPSFFRTTWLEDLNISDNPIECITSDIQHLRNLNVLEIGESRLCPLMVHRNVKMLPCWERLRSLQGSNSIYPSDSPSILIVFSQIVYGRLKDYSLDRSASIKRGDIVSILLDDMQDQTVLVRVKNSFLRVLKSHVHFIPAEVLEEELKNWSMYSKKSSEDTTKTLKSLRQLISNDSFTMARHLQPLVSLDEMPIDSTWILQKTKQKTANEIVTNRGLDYLDDPILEKRRMIACLRGVYCGICMDIFANPATLPCGHSFCSSCIDDSFQSSEDRVILCPYCRQAFLTTDETKASLATLQIDKELIKAIPSIVDQNPDDTYPYLCKCGGCANIADFTCTVCSFVCSDHKVAHSTDEAYQDSGFSTHWIQPFILRNQDSLWNAPDLKCPTHRFNTVEYICAQSPQAPFKCKLCTCPNDAEHQRAVHTEKTQDILRYIVETMKPKIVDKKEKIEKMLGDINLKMTEKENEFYQSTSAITAQFDELEKKLREAKKAIEDGMKNSSDILLKPLKDKHLELLLESKRLQTAQQIIQSLETSDWQRYMLAELKHAHDYLQSNLASFPESVEHKPCKLVLSLSHNVAQELEKLREFLCGIAPENAEQRATDSETGAGANKERGTNERGNAQRYRRTPTPPPLEPFSLSRRHPAPHVQRQYPSTDAGLDDALERPSGICVHPQSGRVYVADEGLQRLLVFDRQLALLSSHATELTMRKSHHGPRGVAMSASGTLAVADFGGNRVRIYNPDMVLVNEIGWRSKVCGVGLNRPYAVAFDQDENLYVADSGNRRVLRLSRKTGSASTSAQAIDETFKVDLQPGQVLIGLAVTEAGDILALFSGSDKVGVFDRDGGFKRFIPVQETSANGWSSIFYKQGGLFGICEHSIGFVVLYDMDGVVQATLPLEGCLAACFAPDGVLYATNTLRKSVVVL